MREKFNKNSKILRINRPLSFDDLRKMIRTDTKKPSICESIKMKSKKLSFDTFSTSTPTNSNRFSRFEYRKTTKNFLITDYSLKGSEQVSPKDIIKKKFEFFENVKRPERKLSPNKVLEEFFETSEERLESLICLSVLSKATGIVARSGVEELALSYKRQLRQFCHEALKYFDGS